MAHHAASVEIKNPGPLSIPGSFKGVLIGFLAIGVAVFFWTLRSDPSRAWSNYVMNHFFFLSLGLGGVFFAAIQWLTGAMWSTPIRRLGEAFTAYLPVSIVFMGLLYLGIHTLYPWSHPEHVQGDIVLEHKAGYLNVAFFMIRNLLAFGIWILFARKMVGLSVKQDTAGKGPAGEDAAGNKNRILAPIFLILFALTFTMSSFDQLMSLDPHWFSTMFGVYMFAGLFYSVLAAICVLAVTLLNHGKLTGIVNENHLHDLGKFMFAFTVFWAYIGFCQFMLIWYANMPEETMYFIKRFEGGWLPTSIILFVAKFVAPFFLLLPREAKRDLKRLRFVGIWMLAAQWLDLLWLVQPQFYEQGPRIGLAEIGVFLGFLGAFGLAVSRFLGKNNIVAIGDPKLEQAVHHHHQ